MAGKNFDISRFAGTIAPVRPELDTMREIAIDKILDNPRNFYPAPDPEALAALEDSIRANGLLEPPTVIAAEDRTSYRLISGHSRMAAIRVLHAKTPEQWETVPCRVLPTMSEEAEASAVIEANRQRVKSPSLLAEEAEKLTELYIKRREAGEDLPGRIRDRVAEALQVKSTKIANVTAIKNGIKVPGIAERWKRDEIPEAAALMIARMDIDEQYRLLDWMIDKHRSYTINEVRMFSICYTVTRRKCEHTGRMCENAERMYDHDYRYGEWKGSNCCLHCLDRDTCPAACQYVEKKPVEQPEAPAVNPAVADPRLDYKVMVPTLPEGQLMIAGWMPGSTNPAEPGEFAAYVNLGDGKLVKRFFDWDGQHWMMPGGIEAQAPVVWWLRLPPVPDKEG